jgi:hypothetical protein
MKVAYIFESNNAFTILENMIVPQMEENRHGADVVGMVFFFDNAFMITEGIPLAERINDGDAGIGLRPVLLSAGY